VRELTARGTVLDVCPISNVRTRAVASLTEHPLPVLVGSGVACSVSTDDPAMFGTDLSTDYAAAVALGVSPAECYAAGVRGALCDDRTRGWLTRVGAEFDWSSVTADAGRAG
jgi:aminodeoxyfutalosine deaminase